MRYRRQRQRTWWRTRRLWWRLALVTAATYAAGALVLIAWLQFDDLANIATRLEAAHPWTTVGHLVAIAALALVWAPLMRWLSRFNRFNARQYALLVSFRWPVVTLVMAYELLVIQLPSFFGQLS